MNTRRSWRLLSVLGLVGLAMLDGGVGTTERLVAEGAVAPAVGSIAPPFRLTTIDGRDYTSASLRGKVVILFAMFASCADCIPQGQTLSQVQQTYSRNGVSVLGVDIVREESVQALRQYQRVGQITIPLAAYSADVVQQYQLVQPDMTYVIGRDAIIRFKNTRPLRYADFQRELGALR